jgi:hypothetical protein
MSRPSRHTRQDKATQTTCGSRVVHNQEDTFPIDRWGMKIHIRLPPDTCHIPPIEILRIRSSPSKQAQTIAPTMTSMRFHLRSILTSTFSNHTLQVAPLPFTPRPLFSLRYCIALSSTGLSSTGRHERQS